MSKFHINKHGVPAPCRAKQGNCPLGGDESHYNTQAEAQQAADQMNESEHGIISGIDGAKEKYVIEIDDQAFNGSFPETYDNNGYTMTGVQKVTLLEDAERENNEAVLELKKHLPDEILNDKEDYTLVPEHNAQDFYKYQVISADTQEGSIDNYRAMVDTVREYNPELIREHMSEDAIDRDFEEEIAQYAAEKSLSESKLTINGQRVIVGKHGGENWAKEYIESIKDEE